MYQSLLQQTSFILKLFTQIKGTVTKNYELKVVWMDWYRLGDGPPAIQYFVNSPFNIILNLKVFRRLTPNDFEFTKVF